MDSASPLADMIAGAHMIAAHPLVAVLLSKGNRGDWI
jgi:hypothetical protein